MPSRTLITTLPPMVAGGVSAKARILADALAAAGREVTVAYYRLPGNDDDGAKVIGPYPRVAVDCRLPVLEQNYTADSQAWRQLIAEHDRHVAVGGTVLIAYPLAKAKVRHLVWCAADLHGDRSYREAGMPWWRRGPDRWLVRPALERQQREVLEADNRIFAISGDTVSRLTRLAPGRTGEIARMTVPVDTNFFTPDGDGGSGLVAGFAGRLDDPRKNASLLFAALAEVRRRGTDLRLMVTGDETPRLAAMIARHGLGSHVAFTGTLDREGLRGFYRSLDLFVLTSRQEGLAIVAIEAMACGVPVVATDCGGPADYVVPGENGILTGFAVSEVADAISRIAGTPELRRKMSQTARKTAVSGYSMAGFDNDIRRAWHDTWGEDL